MFAALKKQRFAFLLTCALVVPLSLLIAIAGLGLCLGIFMSDSFHATWLVLTLGTTVSVLVLFLALTVGVHRRNRLALIAAPIIFLTAIDYLIVAFNNFRPDYFGFDAASLARIVSALVTTLLIGSVYIRELRRNWQK